MASRLQRPGRGTPALRALLFAVCLACAACDTLLRVRPGMVPAFTAATGSRATVLVELSPSGLSAASFDHAGPASQGGGPGATTSLAASASTAPPVAGVTIMQVALPDTTFEGIGSLQWVDTSSGSRVPALPLIPLRYYRAPSVTGATPNGLTSAGLVTVTLTLSGPPPTSAVSVLSLCAGPDPLQPFLTFYGGASMQWTADSVGTVRFSYRVDARVGSSVPSGGGTTTHFVTFASVAVPNDCASQAWYLSYNGGTHWHYSGRATPTTAVPPLKMVSLYPFTIPNSPWVAAHNEARIQLGTAYVSAVDARSYYEEAWRVPALPTGTLVERTFFSKAIRQENATFIVCAGTQFNATPVAVANPDVNILVLSTLRRVLPNRANLAFATGRMYEAMWYAGFVAASVSKTGTLGFIMSLNDPGSYSFVNAFLLGARAAHTGRFTSYATPPIVQSHIIGAFSDDWAEKNAAVDLLDDPVNPVDVLFPVTDNPSPQQECHKRGCYSLGFNADERAQLGDSVLMSTLFKLTPIYLEFVRKITAGEAFGGISFDGGLGLGVDLTLMSPVVPLATQSEVRRRLALSMAYDDLEEVFCGDLTARLHNGTVLPLLIASTGTVMTGLRPPVRGEFGQWCLNRADVYSMTVPGTASMRWTLDGVTVKTGGETYVPPPRPAGPAVVPWELADEGIGLYAGLAVLALIIIALATLSACVVVTCRSQDVIRFASPLFLAIIAFGGIVTGAAILVSAFGEPSGKQVTDTTCTTSFWLEGLGFAFMYGALFAKTYRVDKIFNNKRLKRMRLNVWYVIRVHGVVMLLELAVLAALTVILRPLAREMSIVDPVTKNTVRFYSCRPSESSQAVYGSYDPFLILMGLHFALLLWGAVLAYRTRNVPLGFNESRYIALSIYVFIVASVVAFVLSSAGAGTVDSSPSLQYALILVRTAVPALNTILMVFGPKVLELGVAWWYGRPGDDEDPNGKPGARQGVTNCWLRLVHVLMPEGRRSSPSQSKASHSKSSDDEANARRLQGGGSGAGSTNRLLNGSGQYEGRAGGSGSFLARGGSNGGMYSSTPRSGQHISNMGSSGGSSNGGVGGAGGGAGGGGRSSSSNSSSKKPSNVYKNVKAAPVLPQDAQMVPVTDVMSEDQMAHIAGGSGSGLYGGGGRAANGSGADLTANPHVHFGGDLDAGDGGGRSGHEGSGNNHPVLSSPTNGGRSGRFKREPERGVIGRGNPTIQQASVTFGGAATGAGGTSGLVVSAGAEAAAEALGPIISPAASEGSSGAGGSKAGAGGDNPSDPAYLSSASPSNGQPGAAAGSAAGVGGAGAAPPGGASSSSASAPAGSPSKPQPGRTSRAKAAGQQQQQQQPPKGRRGMSAVTFDGGGVEDDGGSDEEGTSAGRDVSPSGSRLVREGSDSASGSGSGSRNGSMEYSPQGGDKGKQTFAGRLMAGLGLSGWGNSGNSSSSSGSSSSSAAKPASSSSGRSSSKAGGASSPALAPAPAPAPSAGPSPTPASSASPGGAAGASVGPAGPSMGLGSSLGLVINTGGAAAHPGGPGSVPGSSSSEAPVVVVMAGAGHGAQGVHSTRVQIFSVPPTALEAEVEEESTNSTGQPHDDGTGQAVSGGAHGSVGSLPGSLPGSVGQ